MSFLYQDTGKLREKENMKTIRLIFGRKLSKEGVFNI